MCTLGIDELDLFDEIYKQMKLQIKCTAKYEYYRKVIRFYENNLPELLCEGTEYQKSFYKYLHSDYDE